VRGLGGGGYFGYEYYYEHVPPIKQKEQSQEQSFIRGQPPSRTSPSRTAVRSGGFSPKGKGKKPAPTGPKTSAAQKKIHSNLKKYKRDALFDDFNDGEVPREQNDMKTPPHIEKTQQGQKPEKETPVQHISKTEPKNKSAPEPVFQQKAEEPKTADQKKLDQKKKEAFGELDELLGDDDTDADKELDELTK
jgi:hypothetical protein